MKILFVCAAAGLLSLGVCIGYYADNKPRPAPYLVFCGDWKTPEIFLDANHTPVITFKSLDGKATLYAYRLVDWNIGNCASGN